MPAQEHAEGGLMMLLLFAWLLTGSDGKASVAPKTGTTKKPARRKKGIPS